MLKPEKQMLKTKKQTGEYGWLIKFTKNIERVGNRMPHPVYLFLFLTVVIMIASALCAAGGVSVMTTTIVEGKEVQKEVAVVSMLSAKGFAGFFSNMWSSYSNLSTLSLLIMVVMGMSVAEHSGFFSAVLRKSLLAAPRSVVTYALCVVGICANICGDAGMILGASLGCLIYKAIGRNPWVGGITGYASAAAGYTANLIPASVDANLSSITMNLVTTMNIINPATGALYNVHALSNYIFMIVSTFVLAAVVAVTSETYLVKFFGDEKVKPTPEELEKARPTAAENKGLKYASIAFLFLLVLTVWASLPGMMLRNADNKLLPTSPLMSSVIPLIFIFFTTIGSAYGIGAGVIKKSGDIPKLMIKGVSEMSSMWVIFFFVAQMLYVFNNSNLATVISVMGENFLRSIGLIDLRLLLVFSIIVMFINLFMYSASAKWLLLSPVFIPMFANLGIHPAITQIAYRMGDSCTNSITPLNACLIATVAILNKNKDPRFQGDDVEAGVGTVISTVFVFCMAMFVAFLALFSIFWIFNIPYGIGM